MVDNTGGVNVGLKVGENVVSLLTTLLPCFQVCGVFHMHGVLA